MCGANSFRASRGIIIQKTSSRARYSLNSGDENDNGRIIIYVITTVDRPVDEQSACVHSVPTALLNLLYYRHAAMVGTIVEKSSESAKGQIDGVGTSRGKKTVRDIYFFNN